MKRTLIGLSVLLLGMSLSQCYYDKEGILYPDSGTCTPTTNPSYKNDVVPILTTYCTSCHNTLFPDGSVNLETYDGSVKAAKYNGLMGSINHQGGYIPMPKNGAKLSDCEIQNIQAWVDAGLPNN